ncbi:MAG: enoyl-CoA hydratase/isomerase family protein [Gammaproteobacteria bacterium]|nr:enoyl-CoA hydratase/isomerase family protein [Gammaproteobacteria bacterium]
MDARGVATLTLNRPEKRNAFDEHLIAELSTLLAEIAEKDSVRVVLLRAAGTSFCAGADLDWMRRVAGYDVAANLADAGALATLLNRLDTLPQPVIACVQGAALGGGAGLVCCCDMAVATANATFGFSEVRLGLIPATISPYAIRAIGRRAARRYFLTGERFDAATALRIGMVSEVVHAAALDQSVERLVQALLDAGPRAVREAKRFIEQVAGRPIDSDLIARTSRRIADIRSSPEGREGLSAFLDKRPPAWKK